MPTSIYGENNPDLPERKMGLLTLPIKVTVIRNAH
jgi:hypothetical protein